MYSTTLHSLKQTHTHKHREVGTDVDSWIGFEIVWRMYMSNTRSLPQSVEVPFNKELNAPQ